jgi:hypothetical protein
MAISFAGVHAYPRRLLRMTTNAQGDRNEAGYDERPNPDWLAFGFDAGHTLAAPDLEISGRDRSLSEFGMEP